ncbi:MAG: DUF554 domain-containing protein [Lachnospiraceae bacterium]|nr:DUF554 domain-containing protein [Lachnospiraceae bacterium]
MIGTGTLVNAGAIILGTTIGVLLKGGIPERIRNMIYLMVGVAVMFIGILGVVNNEGDSMLLVLSLVIGGALGELLRIEERMEALGEKVKKKFVKEDAPGSATFAEGFVSATLLFCIGAMAIVGSLNDGMLHDPSMLYTKAILDGITSIILAASLGFGVGFSAIPILIYQGILTILASVISGFFTDELIRNMSFVGNVVIFCIGLNFLFPKKIKTGNLAPALFMPIILGFFIH